MKNNSNVIIIKHGKHYDPIKFTCNECACEFSMNFHDLPDGEDVYAVCPECDAVIEDYDETENKFDFYNQ